MIDLRFLKLTQDKFALVDPDVAESLGHCKWYARWNPCTKSFYAVRNLRLPNGERTTEQMHRRIIGLERGVSLQVDHLNHDTLDNRRENLRITDSRGNGENRRDQSRYGFGVKLDSRRKVRRFQAYARIGGKCFHIGLYATPEEAQGARQKWLSDIKLKKDLMA